MHENEPSLSNQATHHSTEQIPHSGIHHDERPVEEFDNTPLPEAVERGLVSPIPDSTEALSPKKTVEVKRSSRRKLIIGGTALIAGAAVVAGSVIGFKVASDTPKNQPPKTDPKTTSHTPEASPTPTGAAEVLTVKSVEIPAGMSPEQLGTTLVQRMADWDMDGTTAKNRDAYFAEGAKTGDAGAYAKQISEASGNIYAEALFGQDWQSEPKIATYVTNEKVSQAASLELWFKTSSGIDSRDKEPFKTWNTVDSVNVVSQSGDSVTERIAVTAHNNVEKNTAAQFDPGVTQLNGEKFEVDATFTTVNGVNKVSNFNIVKP